MGLRVEHPLRPACVALLIQHPPMETKLAPCPELETIRDHPKPRPRGRARDSSPRKPHERVTQALRQGAPTIRRRGLARGPRPQLVPAWPRRPIGIRLLVRYLRHAPFDQCLLHQWLPEETQRRPRIGGELLRLPTRETRIEDEPSRIERFQQHGPGGWAPLSIGRCQRHGCWLRQSAPLRPL